MAMVAVPPDPPTLCPAHIGISRAVATQDPVEGRDRGNIVALLVQHLVLELELAFQLANAPALLLGLQSLTAMFLLRQTGACLQASLRHLQMVATEIPSCSAAAALRPCGLPAFLEVARRRSLMSPLGCLGMGSTGQNNHHDGGESESWPSFPFLSRSGSLVKVDWGRCFRRGTEGGLSGAGVDQGGRRQPVLN